MSFAIDFVQANLYATLTVFPYITGCGTVNDRLDRRIFTTVRLGPSLRLRIGTLLFLIHTVEGTLPWFIVHHIVGITIGVDDRNRTRRLGSHVTDRVTGYRSTSGDLVRHIVRHRIGEHTSHGETRHVDTLQVDLVLGAHLLDDRLDEGDIRPIGTQVPRGSVRLRIDDEEFRRVGHLIPAGLLFLISYILPHTVSGNNHRSVFTHSTWRIYINRTVLTVHIDGTLNARKTLRGNRC